MEKQPIVAFLYDFDKTLCTTDMQNYAFIPSLGMTPAEFWELANGFGRRNRIDGILAYMYTMIQESKRKNILFTRQDLVGKISDICHNLDKVRGVIVGGSSRQESVALGLQALSEKAKLAAIQDGARPLITDMVIDRTVRAANTYGAAAPAIPVKDTIKVVSGGIISATPDRKTLQAVQTPQVFDIDLLKAALKKAADDGAEVTDDCSAVERLGMSVKIVMGDERNIKVTTPLDLKIAELFLEEMQ